MEDINSLRIVVNDIPVRTDAEVRSLLSAGFQHPNIFTCLENMVERTNLAAFFLQSKTAQAVCGFCDAVITGWPKTDLQQTTTIEAFIMGICDINARFPFIIFSETDYASLIYRSRRNILVMQPNAIRTTGIRLIEMLRTLSS